MLLNIFFYLIAVLSSLNTQMSCHEAITLKHFQNALQSCEKALAKQTTKDAADTLLQLVKISNELDLPEKKQHYLQALKENPEFNKTPRLKYNWLRWQGKHSYFSKDYIQAKKYFLEALSVALIVNNKWLADSYNDLGVVANAMKNFAGALAYYKKSLDISLLSNDYYLMGVAYNNIATISMLLEDYDGARKYYKIALDTYQKYKSKSDSHTSKNISHKINHTNESLLKINIILADKKQSEFYAAKIAKELPPSLTVREEIRSIINFVRLYIQKGEYELAQYFLKNAEKLSENSNNIFLSEIHYQFAKLQQKQGHTDESITSAISGLNTLENDDFINLSKFYLTLSELFEQRSFKESFKFYKLYQINKEKLLEKKFNNDIKNIQYHIEKEKIENELNLVKIDKISADLTIKSLTNNLLMITIILILALTVLISLYYSKKRQTQHLLEKIKHHKQQLLLMDEKLSNRVLYSDVPNESVTKESFCKQLVLTMTNAVDLWERHTHTNRVELADQSRIWTISNDDGTLRTRSLDKYLSIEKIPKNPRWRYVVRTCHFILSDSSLISQDRELLEKQLSKILSLYQNLSSRSNTPSLIGFKQSIHTAKNYTLV